MLKLALQRRERQIKMQEGMHKTERSVPQTSPEYITPVRKGDLLLNILITKMEPSSEDRRSRVDLKEKEL